MTKNKPIQTNLIVIGSGPGGYTAAFRAADLGLNVILIEKDSQLGGVCLNRGCIPSKAFLHAANIINESKKAKKIGLSFEKPKIDIEKLHSWKNSIISNLNLGIKELSKKRNIQIINGTASFLSAEKIEVIDNQNKKIIIEFKNCIIATGSSPTKLRNSNISDPRIINSTQALSLKRTPKKMLIIGGGYIGLELGSVYQSLGTKITIAEYFPNLLSMADADLVQPLYQNLKNKFENIFLSTEVTNLLPRNNKINATFKTEDKMFMDDYDYVLISIGRTPNTQNLNLDKAGIYLDNNGFIPTNNKKRTIIPNIYAIGDVTGNPMLAHKATHEAKVAAENIFGKNTVFEPIAIPSVIYTNPELAWAGFTENELNEKGVKFKKAIFPWSANGRALTMDQSNGKTKILITEDESKILGIGIVGHNAGELIGEAMLAIEMGANIEDIGLTIHAHPTLSETINNASEMLTKTITDLYIK